MKAEIQFIFFRVKWEIGPENIKYRKGKAECKFIKITYQSESDTEQHKMSVYLSWFTQNRYVPNFEQSRNSIYQTIYLA